MWGEKERTSFDLDASVAVKLCQIQEIPKSDTEWGVLSLSRFLQDVIQKSRYMYDNYTRATTCHQVMTPFGLWISQS